jgi:hypothetical protein
MEVIYRDAIIPRKERREKIRSESISVADAVRVAKNAVEYRENKPKK